MTYEKHGLTNTRIERIWRGMKQRCYNPRNPFFKYYGERGITICDRWKNSLKAFFEDMGNPPKGYTIDREDNDGNYSPENCRWVTRKTQQNNRGVNIFVEFNGVKKTIKQWSEHLGIPHQTISQRIILGWKPEKILSKEKFIDKSGLSLGGIASGEKRKAKTHCPEGHEYTPDNIRPSKNGGRSCKTCHAIRQRIRNGWDPDRAKNTPFEKKRKHTTPKNPAGNP